MHKDLHNNNPMSKPSWLIITLVLLHHVENSDAKYTEYKYIRREWASSRDTVTILTDPEIIEIDRFSHATCVKRDNCYSTCNVSVEFDETVQNCVADLECQTEIILHEKIVPFNNSILLVWFDKNYDGETELRIRFINMTNCVSRDISIVTGVLNEVKIVPFNDVVDIMYMYDQKFFENTTVYKVCYDRNGEQIGERILLLENTTKWYYDQYFAYLFPPLEQIRPVSILDRGKGYFFMRTNKFKVNDIVVLDPDGSEKRSNNMTFKIVPQLTSHGHGKILQYFKRGSIFRIVQYNENLQIVRYLIYRTTKKIVQCFITGPTELLVMTGNNVDDLKAQIFNVKKINRENKRSDPILIDSLRFEDTHVKGDLEVYASFKERIFVDFYLSYEKSRCCINFLIKSAFRGASKLQTICIPGKLFKNF